MALASPHDPPPGNRPRRQRAAAGEEAEATIGDFEASLAAVQSAVTKLESGEMSLGESLRQYETAVAALGRCHASLDVARQRVMVLSGIDEDGNPVTVPMERHEVGQSEEAVDLREKQAARAGRRGAVKTTRKRDPPDNLELDLAPF